MARVLILFLLFVVIVVGTSQGSSCTSTSAAAASDTHASSYADAACTAYYPPSPPPPTPPKAPRCPENEVWLKCPSCKPDTCEAADDDVIDCPYYCGEPGCRCAQGYYRNSSNVCVTKDQCHSCPPNEYYHDCPPCKPDTCAARNRKYKCNQYSMCVPACVCMQGFLRNDDNACVPECDCPTNSNDPGSGQVKTCGNNEEWGCKKASCEKDTCVSLVARFACVENEVCTPGCYCKSGFLREKAGQPCKRWCQCNNMKNSPDSC